MPAEAAKAKEVRKVMRPAALLAAQRSGLMVTGTPAASAGPPNPGIDHPTVAMTAQVTSSRAAPLTARAKRSALAAFLITSFPCLEGRKLPGQAPIGRH